MVLEGHGTILSGSGSFYTQRILLRADDPFMVRPLVGAGITTTEAKVQNTTIMQKLIMNNLKTLTTANLSWY